MRCGPERPGRVEWEVGRVPFIISGLFKACGILMSCISYSLSGNSYAGVCGGGGLGATELNHA